MQTQISTLHDSLQNLRSSSSHLALFSLHILRSSLSHLALFFLTSCRHFLQSPYLFMTCSLISEKNSALVKAADGKPALSGSLVSSLHRLKDTDNRGKLFAASISSPLIANHPRNVDGGFFVFGDVSVKVTGMHRLKFCLFDFQKYVLRIPYLGSAWTDGSVQGHSASQLLGGN
jgi:hypothetical protein